ncbi:MAG: hypothetical protein J6129_02045 [Bacteroidaceae bacterium]|nr:hypothetical protein [Bacteroidaceae bacterium]
MSSNYKLLILIISLVILNFGCQKHTSSRPTVKRAIEYGREYISSPIVKKAMDYGRESINQYLAEKAQSYGVAIPAIKMEPIFVVDSFCVLTITIDVPDKENEGEYFFYINTDNSISEALHCKGALYNEIGWLLSRSDRDDLMWGENKESIYEKYATEFASPDSWEKIYNEKDDFGGTLKYHILRGFDRLKKWGKFFDEHH